MEYRLESMRYTYFLAYMNHDVSLCQYIWFLSMPPGADMSDNYKVYVYLLWMSRHANVIPMGASQTSCQRFSSSGRDFLTCLCLTYLYERSSVIFFTTISDVLA